MRLTLVTTDLRCGGAERVISIIANHWAEKGWPVTLLTFDDGSTPPFYDLDGRIRLNPLDIHQSSSNPFTAIGNNLKRIFMLRQAIRESEPDVVISIMTFVNTLVLFATRGLRIPVVGVEHVDPLMNPIGLVWALLRRWTYTFDACVVVQTRRAKMEFSSTVQAKTTVIPYPAPPNLLSETTILEVELTKHSIVAMGHFSRNKGFDLLLKAFARLKERHPEWTLTILGDGPLRPYLEALQDELGLSGRIHLPGQVKNPFPVLRQADLFIMSSRWEGWSNSLVEAMSCGLPVIAADCRCGPREIIQDGINGVLVPPEDEGALAAAMDQLMTDEARRNDLASRATGVTERFHLNKVMGIWEELLRTVVIK